MFEPSDLLNRALERIENRARSLRFETLVEKQGVVESCADGVTICTGLTDAGSEELAAFDNGEFGLILDLVEDRTGIVVLGGHEKIGSGTRVSRTGRTLEIPVGEGLLGRVVDPLGRPLDDMGRVESSSTLPVERPAPGVLDRVPVSVPLQTGIKVVDSMVPVGRGQRELIIGDRGTGKTSVAVDAILSQKGSGVACVYVAVGQKAAGTGRVIEVLRSLGAMEYTVVVATDAEDAPGLKYAAPFAGCAVAEHFRDSGRDALIIYDDLTRHAEAYREISLLLRRPPGREAFPGDIFYLHSRLLERAARLNPELGGGSLTALPIVETQGGNISAFIPTNLISITDGQIYLDTRLFQSGQLPAVDTGKSVSRVGGKTQLKAVKDVSGRMRLDYNQYLELEYFTRFGARVDEKTRAILDRGKRIKRLLRQPRFEPVGPAGQVALFTAAVAGAIDNLPEESVAEFEAGLKAELARKNSEIAVAIESGAALSDAHRETLLDMAKRIANGLSAID